MIVQVRDGESNETWTLIARTRREVNSIVFQQIVRFKSITSILSTFHFSHEIN